MGILSHFSKIEEIPCPDGSTKRVYKNIDDAVALYIKDSESKTHISTLVAQARATLQNQRNETLSQILITVDRDNPNCVLKLRAAYLSYANDPCNNAVKFDLYVASFIENEDNLTRFRAKVSPLIECIISGVMTPEQFIKAYRAIAIQYPQIDTVSAASAEIINTRENMREWQGGST